MSMRTWLLALVFSLTAGTAGVLLADCADKEIRPNSPCKTQVLSCPILDPMTGQIVDCSAQGETTFNGNFQCDLASNDDYCHGTGQFAPCVVTVTCNKTINPVTGAITCPATPGSANQSNAETQQTDACP